MDGVEGTKALKAHEISNGRSRTPIIAISAHVLSINATRLLEEGMSDNLAKPVSRAFKTSNRKMAGSGIT